MFRSLTRFLRARIREAFTLCKCGHPAALHIHYSQSSACVGCTCHHWHRELFTGWVVR